jgi:hypothetical protein
MLVLLALAIAVASPAEQHFAKGKQLLADLDYEAAAYELMLAATDASADDATRLQANLYAGIAHRVIGKDSDARLNFRYVLLRAPSTRLPPDTSPKVSLYFDSVRQEIEAERAAAPAPPPGPSAAASTGPIVAPAAAQTSMAPLTIAGVTALALGGAAVVAGTGGVLFAETSLSDPDRDGSERSALQNVGQLSTGGAVVGVVVAVVGGVLLAVAP